MYNNSISRNFGYSFLSHFLCSFGCEASTNLAKKYHKTLKRYSKTLANEFLINLKGLILFTEYNGIFIIKKYNYSNSVFYYDALNLKTTIQNNIANFLKNGNNIKIINKNHFFIQKNTIILKEFKGEDVGLMIFDKINPQTLIKSINDKNSINKNSPFIF